MSTEVPMPQLGESIFEGTITKWLKAIGDPVAIDEPLFEISTDKVDAEIPSPVAGVLAEIRFPEGATVEVNTVVAVISEAGTKVAAPAAAAKSPAQRSAPPQGASKAAPAAAQIPAQEAAPPQLVPGGRIRSSPLARRIAKEHGLELGRIAGTGSEGRITKDDVLRAANSPASAQLPDPKGCPHRRWRTAVVPQVSPPELPHFRPIPYRSHACVQSLPSGCSRACASALMSIPFTKST